MSEMITKNQKLNLFSKMTKYIGSCCFLIVLLLMSSTSWAQNPGNVCEGPIPISGLPFSVTDNTSNYGDDYESGDRPALAPGAIGNPSASYLSGDDVVYAYTPTADGFVDITVTEHGTWAGVFVFTGCPFESTLGGHTNSSGTMDLEVIGLSVEAGVTYYIVISTYATPQSTPYTLSVTETVFECTAINANIGDACDDGDATTVNDSINENCECEGEPTNPGEICGNPLEVNELPFNTTDNTENFGNNYGSSDVPALAVGAIGNPTNYYLNGDDVVYAYSPSADGFVDIAVTNHGTYAGVFVFTGCPFASTLGGNTNSSASVPLEVNALPVVAGETYYIVISTWASPQSTPYTLDVVNTAFDCPALLANIGDACDDENPSTVNTVLDEDCNCGGGVAIAANDDACSATALVCGETIAQSMAGSTPSMSDNCNGSGAADVWFSFTSDGSQIITVAENSSFDAIVQLFASDDCDNLVEVGACKDNPENYTVTEAGNYFFRVRPYFSSAESDSISVYLGCVDYDCPDLLANIGSTCDDNDSGTYNDVVDEDCNCTGTPYDCYELEADFGTSCTTDLGLPGELNTDCDCEPVYCQNTSSYGSANMSIADSIRISTCNYLTEYSTISGVQNGFEYKFTGVVNDTEALAYVTVRSGSAGGPVVGSGMSPLTITAPSTDNLFVHWTVDENCNKLSSCATTTAVCVTCATVIDCEGITGGSALPGTSCDDGDATTYNDLYNENCDCVGIPYDCTDLLANIGDACDDGDVTTVNDTVNEDCECGGEPAVAGSICESAIAVVCNAEPVSYSSVGSLAVAPSGCSVGKNGMWFSFVGTGADITINSSASFDHKMSMQKGSCDDLTYIVK